MNRSEYNENPFILVRFDRPSEKYFQYEGQSKSYTKTLLGYRKNSYNYKFGPTPTGHQITRYIPKLW